MSELDASYRIQDCASFQAVENPTWEGYLNLGVFMEQRFQCSGVCHKAEMYSFTNIEMGVPPNDCSQIILKSLEGSEHQEYILVWILFANSLMAILAIGFLVVNFPEYNNYLMERRAKLELSAFDSKVFIDS